MDTLDTQSTLVLPADLAASMKSAAPLFIAEARKNGVISTREIAAIIRPEARADRYRFKRTIADIGTYLRQIGLVLAKGQTDLERRVLPLPSVSFRTLQSITFRPISDADMKAVALLMEQGSKDFDDTELALYQKVISKFPLLTHSQVMELCKARAAGDIEAHFRLILHNLRLVFFWANKYLNRGLELSDMVQEGILGLMKAIEKFDYTLGHQLSTYAVWWIRQKITRAITDKARSIRIPVHLAQKYYQIQRTSASLEQELGREPTPEEIGARLQISPRYVAKLLFAVLGTQTESFDTDTGENGEEIHKHEIVADAHAVSPVSALEAKEALEEIAAEVRAFLIALATLPTLDERFRTIFRMRYGLDGTFFSRPTLEQVGQKFGVTRERIRQIVEAVWERLTRAGRMENEGWLLQHLEQIEELETVTGVFTKI